MKYLLFNLAVTGALLYLLADAGVITLTNVGSAEQREMAAAQAGKTVVVARRTRDQFLKALGQALDEARDDDLPGTKSLEAGEDQPARRDPKPPVASADQVPSDTGSAPAKPAASDSATLDKAAKEAPVVGRGPRVSESARRAAIPAAPKAPLWEGAASKDRAREAEPLPKARPPKPVKPQVKVVATSDPEVIKRRAEVLGDGFAIAGAESATVSKKPRRRSRARVVPSREVADMTPAERSRELDKLALDMELIFAEMSGR